MTQINPYLNFNGNCREAMTFYQQCLGGKLSLQTVGHSAMAAQVLTEPKECILHASLTRGDLLLMASDMIGPSLVKGNSVTLTINFSSETEIKQTFANLANGGQVIEPLTDMSWGALFGTLTDKFGISWMFNYDKNQM
ncbi:glyoxalase/bleomycin resistance/extradiol dioxygenase family protein [Spirosoma sp. BT702]|uniref:Glyoxalase/bleomycin resistance/extradiol dioxygenase family protein n=1 Tax=Spirosoma profusum TaxID=2771354 RepID=A0A926XYY1_9BACT|nr:glyoxalase/bleomycin resistance/extradiol dioxygenase family protein [Spirosoma profusum]MBD2700428.1 glyoxalase/bleomycin resistance/extradiol dioxygenase family protein [Spirosoma profusum]